MPGTVGQPLQPGSCHCHCVSQQVKGEKLVGRVRIAMRIALACQGMPHVAPAAVKGTGFAQHQSQRTGEGRVGDCWQVAWARGFLLATPHTPLLPAVVLERCSGYLHRRGVGGASGEWYPAWLWLSLLR